MDVDEIQVEVGSSSAAAKASGKKVSLPWVEKYRPESLDELIAHEDIIKILNKLIESNKLPHLLFYGPPGTGMLALEMFRKVFVITSFVNLARQNINNHCVREENVRRKLLSNDIRVECLR